MKRSMKSWRRLQLSALEESGESITSGLGNLFDVAIVFAVALLVALAAYWRNPLLVENQDFTAVVDPGGPNMELVVKENGEIKRYRASGDAGNGEGELLGRAYRLPDGSVVYVPSTPAAKSSPAADKNDGATP
ncbi:MAG: DUF2149 domain-containing protein [Thermoguttaceae bacterium]|nr:DUF2149 domain-containing protein [Thermoguttaceae bacterium]